MKGQEFLLSFGFDNPAVKLWLRHQAAEHGCQLRTSSYAWDLIKGPRTIRIGRRHFASIGNLAAEFDGLFESLVPNRAGSQALLDFSHIQLHKHRASGLKFELGGWPESDAIISAYFERFEPTSDDLVFDIGASGGISSFALSNLAKRVIAFEQDSQLRVILNRNIARLELTNVQVAGEAITSLQDLMDDYGKASFCKVNLDQVELNFFAKNQALKNGPPVFAASSSSKKTRQEFTRLLSDVGYQIESNESLGVLWAKAASHAPE